MCVVYLLRERAHGGTDVLLGYKRTGLGLGKVVGIGGKVEPDESIVEAAVREVFEETALRVEASDLMLVGELEYHFPAAPSWSQRSHVFVGRRWQGEPTESDEIVPHWFSIDEVPYDRMWDDAQRWLPGVLRGGRVEASFTFGDDLSTVVDPPAA